MKEEHKSEVISSVEKESKTVKEDLSEEKKSKKDIKTAKKEEAKLRKKEQKEKKEKASSKKTKKILIIVVVIVLLASIGIGLSYHFGLLDKLIPQKQEAVKKETTKNGWSEWVEELPEEVTEENYEIEEKTQYAKQTKETKTSTSKTLKGWTLYETKSTGEEKTEEVETEKAIKEFENNKDIEITEKEVITEKYKAILCGYYNPEEGQNRFYTPSEEKPYCKEKDSYTLEEDEGKFEAGTYKVGDNFTDKGYTNTDGTKIYYKVIEVIPYKIKYTYKDSDSKTTYYFYKWTSWSKYQDEEIEENDTTKVKTRTVYRYKEK